MSPSSSLSFDSYLNSELAQILFEARRLQIERINAAFKAGWRFPKGICHKYRSWYVSLDTSGEKRKDAYTRTCNQFCAEVNETGGFPPGLTRLDPITLFGEICCGWRMENGTYKEEMSETIH